MDKEENAELELAWQYVTRTSENIFLTGRAGTGKTTFLKRVVAECPKRKIVLAPTGAAAVNAGGVTLHSFFQLPLGLFIPEYRYVHSGENKARFSFHRKKLQLIRSIELMIIDEVSMVRADLLDEVDAALRRIRRSTLPFGGVQALLIGDASQLAPVVREEEREMLERYYDSPCFFDSKVLRTHGYRMISLRKIYRQQDAGFIEILGAVRENRLTPALLEKLNSRYIPGYQAPDGCITLCTHNSMAGEINDARLRAIHAPEYRFKATVTGNFPENSYPQEAELVLKKGAQVMFTKNDPAPEKRYVNGTIGVVSHIDGENITVTLENGEEVEAVPLSWENLKYVINEETREIVSETDGVFTQYPLKTAWAITIHKSQGLTFERAFIDAGAAFSPGQVYVALSRCRTLEGIVLRDKIRPVSIFSDRRTEDFSRYVDSSLPTPEELEKDMQACYAETLKRLYGVERLQTNYYSLLRFAQAAFPGLYPTALAQWSAAEADKKVEDELFEVAFRFRHVLDRLVGPDYRSSEHLRERLRKASVYFRDKAGELLLPLVNVTRGVDFDDKAKKKLFRQYYGNFCETLFLHLLLWNYTAAGFDFESYLKERALLSAELADRSVTVLLSLYHKALQKPGAAFAEYWKCLSPAAAGNGARAGKNRKSGRDDGQSPLFDRLRVWRLSHARKEKLPVYAILHQKTLLAIVDAVPQTAAELRAIKGIGRKFMEKYGEEMLELLRLP